ncbi:natural resistance-associated macrophage protein [Paraburkholderia sp. BL10I2N1]|nr:natural resistance-associated macrophage protein [Paraburkholderia sp. BL10I2N1]
MTTDIEPPTTPVGSANPWLEKLGPGLVTGAADDDPSGIATYSQAGAAFGYNVLWTTLLTYPLMVAIQLVSARIGRVSGPRPSDRSRHVPLKRDGTMPRNGVAARPLQFQKGVAKCRSHPLRRAQRRNPRIRS